MSVAMAIIANYYKDFILLSTTAAFSRHILVDTIDFYY